MTLETKWGPVGNQTTLPNPDSNGILVNDAFIGSSRRTLRGAFRASKVAEKAQISIRWSGMTAAQKLVLRTAFDSFAAIACLLTLPDARDFTVVAAPGGWQEQLYYLEDGTLETHDVSLTFFEV